MVKYKKSKGKKTTTDKNVMEHIFQIVSENKQSTSQLNQKTTLSPPTLREKIQYEKLRKKLPKETFETQFPIVKHRQETLIPNNNMDHIDIDHIRLRIAHDKENYQKTGSTDPNSIWTGIGSLFVVCFAFLYILYKWRQHRSENMQIEQNTEVNQEEGFKLVDIINTEQEQKIE